MTPSSSAVRAERRRALLRELVHGAGLVGFAGAALFAAILLPSRLKTERLRTQKAELAAEVQTLEAEVRGLAEEARALESDPYEVERLLRARLGFVRPGERVVVVTR